MQSAPRAKPYPWIDAVSHGPEYLAPLYYNKILKPYIFFGSSDLDLFRAFVLTCHLQTNPAILEIGPGTGRATSALCSEVLTHRIDLVDKSQRMLAYLESQLPFDITPRFFKQDAVSFLTTSHNTYDFVYSLWSLSHSIHQNIAAHGLHNGRARAVYGLRRLFSSLLNPLGKFFFIHFDSMSEEQELSLRQRSRVETWIAPGVPSPSQLLIEEILCESADSGLIQFKRQHLVGSPIVYSGVDEALEIFMNFHMEGMFNRTPKFSQVALALTKEFRQHRLADGRIALRPGCLIYTGERL